MIGWRNIQKIAIGGLRSRGINLGAGVSLGFRLSFSLGLRLSLGLGLSLCLGVAMAITLAACGKKAVHNPFDPNAPAPSNPSPRSASIGVVGDTADVQTPTRPGLVIMGGGTDVDAAFRWMIERSGGGDVVIIRATGTDAYNAYVNRLGKVNSVETLRIDSRKLANDEGVARMIRQAEMLFIAGGDQSDYTGYWKGTKTMDAINYLLTEKKVPVGGTSAGAAILGNYYFSADRGGVSSSEALANPYTASVTIGRGDFLKAPFLQQVLTDQHFSQRDRQGRVIAFLGRIFKDWDQAPRGIAVDERTAVCIDESGIAQVVGSNRAYFIKTNPAYEPEIFMANQPVTWNNEGKALDVSAISATATDNRFNLTTFEAENTSGLEKFWWTVMTGHWAQAIRPEENQ